jgi:hypothetical protein
MASFGSVAVVSAAGALPASATAACGSATSAPGCLTNTYTIGSPSGGVNNVTVTPTTGTTGVSQSYTITFVAVSALATGNTITIGDSLGNALVSTIVPSTVALISGTCLQAGSATNTTAGASGLIITLTTPACPSITAGSTVTVTFNAGSTSPAQPSGSFNFTVATSTNATAVNTPTVTVSSAPPSLTAGTLAAGQTTTYTITGAGASNATGGSWSTLSPPATVLELTSTGGAITFAQANNPTASYTVTYTPSGGTAATDPVTTVTPITLTGAACTPTLTTPCAGVALTLTTAVASGGTVNIVASGVNPIPPATTQNVAVFITPASGTAAPFAPSGNQEMTGTVNFGSSVKSVTLAVSPLVAGASATYTLGFTATTTTTAGNTTITVAEGKTGFTGVSGVLVTDTTGGWHIVTNTVTTTGGTSPSLTVPAVAFGSNVIKGGDAVTVTIAGVSNPPAGTYTDFAVTTSADTVAANAPSYTITAAGTAGVNVVVNPPTVGTLATYTVTGLFASSAITGGLTANAITLTGPAGTVFPTSASSYLITDSTTPSGSGTVVYAPTVVGANGGVNNSVTFVPPNSIVSGDVLTITITTVINPSASSSGYQLTIFGPVTAATGVAAFPKANVTFPNSALINFAGTIYVFAGGHAFGIPTPTVLNKIRAVNPAVVLNAAAGTVVPVVTARSGTLISMYAVNGNPTIYVVGNDGELHGFSTPKQYKAAGYDTALNTTVNNAGGLTIGSTVGVLGANSTALATSSDGAIVDSSGTYYTFGGGRALGIPTPARLNLITAHNNATILTGTVSTAQKQATVASGVLLSVGSTTGGAATVYVSFNGNAFPFKTLTQLKNDGYGGTPAVQAPNTGGLPVVPTYTGS